MNHPLKRIDEFNKIIDSLKIGFNQTKNISILRPVSIDNSFEVENNLLLVNKGEIKFGKNQIVAGKGDIIFLPGGCNNCVTYGSNPLDVVSKEDLVTNRHHYFCPYNPTLHELDSYQFVSFEVKAFDSINFFSSLNIPAFKVETGHILTTIFLGIIHEAQSNLPGRRRIIEILTEQLAIELIRYIFSNKMFEEQLATNTNYFKDARLVEIFIFIKNNLDKDLSNKALAKVINISEDYVGQYFKMLTGINIQDYIENQRMEVAIKLLRTSNKSIQDIGKDVGYKDTAYFCRRFKMTFGIPASKMRKQESKLNS